MTKKKIEATFTFTTTDPDVAKRICEVVSQLSGQNQSPDEADDPTVQQIMDALAYAPLSAIQLTILNAWLEASAEEWIPVGLLHRRVVDEGLAQDMKQAVQPVRNALGGLAGRMTRKLKSSSRVKLEGLAEVRREGGTAAYRLHREGRSALLKFLKPGA